MLDNVFAIDRPDLLVVFGALGVLAIRDPHKAKQAVRIGVTSFLGLLPSILALIGLIGLLVTIVPPEYISRYLGQEAGLWATLTAALLGTLLYLPSLVSFPLAASLLRAGAGIATVAAFLTSLVMVGTVTLPLEMKHLGNKTALGRNLLSLIFALGIALLMGMILK